MTSVLYTWHTDQRLKGHSNIMATTETHLFRKQQQFPQHFSWLGGHIGLEGYKPSYQPWEDKRSTWYTGQTRMTFNWPSINSFPFWDKNDCTVDTITWRSLGHYEMRAIHTMTCLKAKWFILVICLPVLEPGGVVPDSWRTSLHCWRRLFGWV